GRTGQNHRISSGDSFGAGAERSGRRPIPGPLDPRHGERRAANGASHEVVQESMSDASTRAEYPAWQQRAAQRRPSLPMSVMMRTAVVLSGAALAGIGTALYLQDGFSRGLAFAGLLAPGVVALAYGMVRMRERKLEAEAALVENQLRFDMAFAGARCGIWDWDLTANRVYWSSAMFDMLGLRQPSKRLSPA